MQVELRMSLREDSLEVMVIDDAAAFNPLEAPRPDVTQPLERRKVGGLGVVLVGKLMDAMEYERKGDRNQLVLRRRLSAVSEGERGKR